MTPTSSRRQLDEHVRKLSRTTARLLAGAIAIYPICLALYAFAGGPLILTHPWMANRGLQAADLTAGVSTVFFLALALAAAPLVWGLVRLRQMFAEFAAGRMFSVAAITAFERFAWAIGATALAEPLASGLFGVLLPLAGAPVPPVLALSFSSTDAVALLLSLVLGVVAKVMRMAALLAEENAGYV